MCKEGPWNSVIALLLQLFFLYYVREMNSFMCSIFFGSFLYIALLLK